MGQRHVCTFRHALRAAYRTAISAAQILVSFVYSVGTNVPIVHHPLYHTLSNVDSTAVPHMLFRGVARSENVGWTWTTG